MNKKKSINQTKLLGISAIFCITALIIMGIALNQDKETVIGEFIAPAFDSSVEEGIPEVDNASYTEVYMEGMSFRAYVCALFSVEDGTAQVYFTNLEENEAWLRLRIWNQDGEVVAETGIIKPGEYVEMITFTQEVSSGEGITLEMMSYEEETYQSLGSVQLNTILE